MDPAALGARLAIHLGQRLPETQGPIADGQPRVDGQAPALHVPEQTLPGFLGFPESVTQRHELLFAVYGGADHDEEALVGLLLVEVGKFVSITATNRMADRYRVRTAAARSRR